MKITLKTEKLQEMVSRAIKGCSNKKMIAMTSYLSIELSDHNLILTTTDASNYLYIMEDKIEGEDFNVVVEAETFAKLISRMTTEDTSLEIDNQELVVVGNGRYKIELPLDEEGMLVKFPRPLDAIDIKKVEKKYDINLTTIKTLLTVNKSALSTNIDVPCYTGYYMGDNVVTTDTYKICGTGIKLFDEPILISTEMMDLLDVMSDENIKVYIDNNTLVFVTKDCIVYGKTLEGIDAYKIDAIQGLLDLEFPSKCSVSKTEILQALDRLSLFVGPYDKNGIRMTFTRDGLMLANVKDSSTETIPYKSSADFKEFTCLINVDMLQSQIKAHVLDEINMCYGLDNALKIVDGNIVQIIAYEEQ